MTKPSTGLEVRANDPIGGVTIPDIVGRLTIDEAAQHLKDTIDSLVSQHASTRSQLRLRRIK